MDTHHTLCAYAASLVFGFKLFTNSTEGEDRASVTGVVLVDYAWRKGVTFQWANDRASVTGVVLVDLSVLSPVWAKFGGRGPEKKA